MKTADPWHVWTASDLSRQRTAILAEAEDGIAFVRATSGRMLVLTSADRLTLLEGLPRITRILVAATHLLDDSAGMSELGELAFASDWPLKRRRQFVSDLRDVCQHAVSVTNLAEIDAFIAASRPRPALGVIDPARIAAIFNNAPQ